MFTIYLVKMYLLFSTIPQAVKKGKKKKKTKNCTENVTKLTTTEKCSSVFLFLL